MLPTFLNLKRVLKLTCKVFLLWLLSVCCLSLSLSLCFPSAAVAALLLLSRSARVLLDFCWISVAVLPEFCWNSAGVLLDFLLGFCLGSAGVLHYEFVLMEFWELCRVLLWFCWVLLEFCQDSSGVLLAVFLSPVGVLLEFCLGCSTGFCWNSSKVLLGFCWSSPVASWS